VPEGARHGFVKVGLWTLSVLALAVVSALTVRHCGDAKKAIPPAPKTTVTTAPARKGDIGIYLEAIGTVTPVYTASITSQVNGLILAVHYEEGQRVNVGDPLLDIDPRPYRATLMQAQGTLERDKNLLAQATMDLERYRAAWARNAIARQTLDDQEKVVLQDRGTVMNDQGTVQYDQVQVDFCHITAPISGRVGLRLVDPGNVVQPSAAVVLAVVTQLEPITVIFTMPEDNLEPVQVRLRQGAKLTVDALDRSAQKKIASGILLTLDNQIDTTTGTIRARALFDNKNDLLFPNQFVNTRLLVDTLRGVTLVPASSLQQNGPDSFVYVIQGDVAHVRRVKPGVTDNGMTQVDGIDPGDILANSSFDRLHDGSTVVVASAPAAAPSASSAP
jgi:membrane fusion protein, multidrug efflux system